MKERRIREVTPEQLRQGYRVFLGMAEVVLVEYREYVVLLKTYSGTYIVEEPVNENTLVHNEAASRF